MNLKRKGKKPKRLIEIVVEDKNEDNLPETAKKYYEKIYFEACEFLTSRFEQENLKNYENLQESLLLAAKGKNYDEKLTEILTFFKVILSKII